VPFRNAGNRAEARNAYKPGLYNLRHMARAVRRNSLLVPFLRRSAGATLGLFVTPSSGQNEATDLQPELASE
jgi:hypothetical protein